MKPKYIKHTMYVILIGRIPSSGPTVISEKIKNTLNVILIEKKLRNSFLNIPNASPCMSKIICAKLPKLV